MAVQMQVADKATAKEWFQLIEDGVPEDLAMLWLEREATASEAPTEYGNAWRKASERVISERKGLTKAEYLVLVMYTMDEYKFYKKFNGDCRRRKWKCYTTFTSLLHSGLSKLRRKSSGDVRKLYRGLHCNSIDEASDEVYMASFMSTTCAKDTAKRFGPFLVTVESRTGPSIQEFSVFCEQETLFSPFQVFVALADKSSAILRTSIDATRPFLMFPLFRGSLLGAVVGNCIGAPFEFLKPSTTIENLLKKLTQHESNDASRGSWRYTSDTTMLLALADSLVRAYPLNTRDLSQSLSDAYVKNRNRKFGKSVVLVLEELHRQTPNDDPFAPAQKLFNGSGSHGNGGAMRIVPAALLNWNASDQPFNNEIGQITRLTHSNVSGINGAILQARAVQLALMFSIFEERNQSIRERYLDELIKKMQSLETSGNRPYCDKLGKIKGLLSPQPSQETIQRDLGSGVSALDSVPTAIYCFLRGMQSIPGIPEDRTEFERTIIYAVSLGGDTDTIASMAGAIAGAYYGQDSIPQRWRDICEPKAVEDAKRYAKEIHGHLFGENKLP